MTLYSFLDIGLNDPVRGIMTNKSFDFLKICGGLSNLSMAIRVDVHAFYVPGQKPISPTTRTVWTLTTRQEECPPTLGAENMDS
jgi:hypothetical protein